MEPNGADELPLSGSGMEECSETTVEIKIKTLDSQTYTLRVNKYVPVPALKEQIASVTGVLSEQQRLICRGKVLKDDELLSAYHVEDGHTLHLVVRQPIDLSSSSSPGYVDSENGPSHPETNPLNRSSHVGHNVIFETVNLSGQGDPSVSDLQRIFSTVMSSLGINNIDPASVRMGSRDHGSEIHGRTSGNGGSLDPSQQQSVTSARAESDQQNGAFQFASAASLANQHPTVIPDSLSTLSQYISHMRHEFDGFSDGLRAGGVPGSEGQGRESNLPSAANRGLPTPSSLADVMLSGRQLLIQQAAGCLSELASQLQDQAGVTDPQIRASVQSNAVRSGALFQNLGSLLLELGRAVMTLRMGQTPEEAVVNAGPAIFISASGPNPIMVQAGIGVGGFTTGAQHPGHVISGGLGPGFLSRNIDIRIRRGNSAPSATANTSSNVAEQANGQDPSGRTDPARNSVDTFVQRIIQGVSSNASSGGESTVRVVPIRTVIAIPAGVSRTPADLSGNSDASLYPLFSRLQEQLQSNLNGARSSPASTANTSGVSDQQAIPDPARRGSNSESRNENAERDGTSLTTNSSSFLRSSGNESTQHPEGFSGFITHVQGDSIRSMSNDATITHEETAQDSMAHVLGRLQTIFPGEEVHLADSRVHGIRLSTTNQNDTAMDPEGRNPLGQGNEDGVFFSDLLRQIMPFISQSTSTEHTDVSLQNPSSSTEHGERRNQMDADSHRDPPDVPASKRQRTE